MSHAKRYRLTQETIDSWYTQNGKFSFKVGYDKDGGKKIYGPGLCKTITVQDTDVIQTTNDTAQKYLQNFRIPQGVSRDGVRPPSGPVWLDVTATQPTAKVDIDPYFK